MEYFDAQSLHFRYSPILLSFQLRMICCLLIREIPLQGGGLPFPAPDSHWMKLLPSFGALIVIPCGILRWSQTPPGLTNLITIGYRDTACNHMNGIGLRILINFDALSLHFRYRPIPPAP
jgi:hypothetical protein